MNWGWLSLGAPLACLAAFGLGWEGGASYAETQAALARAESNQTSLTSVVEAERDNRQEEDRRHEVSNQTEATAAQQRTENESSASGADDVAGRLRAELQKSRQRFDSSQASCDTRLVQQRNSARAQYDLLAGLYQEADDAAGKLAVEAEKYRVAGMACNQQYQGVRSGPSSK